MNSDQVNNEDYLKIIPESKRSALDRWRLILGQKAEDFDINFNPPNVSDQADQKDINDQQQKDDIAPPKTNNTQKQGKDGSILERVPGGVMQKSLNKAQLNGKKGSQVQGQQTNQLKGKSSGQEGQKIGSKSVMQNELQQMDSTLNLVYGPRNEKRGAGLESSRLSIPKWIENVKKFFPQQTKEVLEKDLVERSDLKDIIKNPELFEKVEPSIEMVKVIISLKHMLPENVKLVARKIVKKVVDALTDKFRQEVEKHIVGALKRDKHTPIKVFRNIDWKQSIRKNLKNYNPKLKKIIMGEPRFFSAERRKKPWQIVVLIDESGSMTDSVIYSIVMASIFASLPSVHTNLAIFDTQVVDLSNKLDDPVDILMSVQLGGGTDITKAVRYGQTLIKNPKKTIMVIISDFYEGRGYDQLTKALKQVLEGQTKILGIAALGHNSQPMYDRRYAKKMQEMGIDVIACTPKNLPELIAKLMK